MAFGKTKIHYLEFEKARNANISFSFSKYQRIIKYAEWYGGHGDNREALH